MYDSNTKIDRNRDYKSEAQTGNIIKTKLSMTKSLKGERKGGKLNKSGQEVQVTETETAHELSQNNQNVQGGRAKSGGRADQSSSEDFPTEAIREARLVPSTTQQYPAPGAPAAAASTDSQDVSFSEEESWAGTPRGLCQASKAIKKNGKSRKRSSNSSSSSGSQDSQTGKKARKINHRKYTVKKCSNFLRKKLKENGFRNFEQLQGERNKRGSTIYLPTVLLIFKAKYPNKFDHVVQCHMKELNRLQDIEKRKLKATGNEKSYHYIIEFERAKQATSLFKEGKYLKCIEKFFGAQDFSFKERTYLQDSINFFNQWREYLGVAVEITEPSHEEEDNQLEQRMSIESDMSEPNSEQEVTETGNSLSYNNSESESIWLWTNLDP